MPAATACASSTFGCDGEPIAPPPGSYFPPKLRQVANRSQSSTLSFSLSFLSERRFNLLDVTTQSATTEAILNEDGADAALAALAKEVEQAERDIHSVLDAECDQPWTVRELQDAAANGHSSSVISIAFLRLLKFGKLRVDHATSVVEAV